MLAEATGSSVGEVLSWDHDEFLIAREAFGALNAKRSAEVDTGTGGVQ